MPKSIRLYREPVWPRQMRAVIPWRLRPGPNQRVYLLNSMPILCIKHSLTLSFRFLIEPPKPTFSNEATTTTVTASFTKVQEEKNQLTYQLQARDTANVVHTGTCAIVTRKCIVSGLTPGRKYLLSVKACISEDTSICGEHSAETISYTIPQSKYSVIVTEPKTSIIDHIFFFRTVAAGR